MANVIITHLTAPAKVIDSILALDEESGELVVDLRKMIPMPDDVYNENGVSDATIKEYNGRTWIAWCPENWGSRWNAFNTERRSTKTVYFETEGAAPLKAIEALSKQWPEVKISIRVADETNHSWRPSNLQAFYLGGVLSESTARSADSDAGKRWASKVRNRKFA